DLKRAFLDGHISEEDLKQSLTDEVRRHFTEDEHAKELLAQAAAAGAAAIYAAEESAAFVAEDSKLSIVFAPMPSQSYAAFIGWALNGIDLRPPLCAQRHTQSPERAAAGMFAYQMSS
ncbi:tyrS, partial [Symbiodinium sp. KB8]